MKTCLITGSEGFLGSHLADLLVENGFDVWGTVYAHTGRLTHLDGRLHLVECDLTDGARVVEVLEQVRPDVVFHLAAQSFVTVAWESPEETLRTNVMGTFNLLEGIRQLGFDPIVEVIGSSSVYGPCGQDEMPLSDGHAFNPTSIYAVSKVAEEMLGNFYWRVHGTRVIRVRPFNMTGPRKTLDACSDFARGIAEVEKGLRSTLEVGNLDTVRDFTDGRDAARALYVLAEKGEPGEVYQICTGKARRLGEALEVLVKLSGRPIEHQVVAGKLRPFDDPVYVGDNSRLRALGWEPQIEFRQTLRDLLDYWRGCLNGGSPP
ncbi:MAG: GDP-mannose 4,6-dehydratase [Dehalococcoidia bacterium]